MGYRNKTYVIFDGDEDMWAYGFMLGWNKNEHMEFSFYNAHDLRSLAADADEATVKRALRHRLENTKQAIVVIGEKTKDLFRFVRWEIEMCLSMGIPMVAVNLNGKRQMDAERCPPILRDTCTVHVPFRAKAIQKALDDFCDGFDTYKQKNYTNIFYPDAVYAGLGL
ncbi:TIR domain-containing protein [Paraburkholderia dipogonis]|uniref:TIR domain-containing protein n=1 Tax=Paraburkholderia dipogonis TaxID=1211383 RepID=A0ABW9B1V2_9BURK